MTCIQQSACCSPLWDPFVELPTLRKVYDMLGPPSGMVIVSVVDQTGLDDYTLSAAASRC